jgi:hypothetical protein
VLNYIHYCCPTNQPKTALQVLAKLKAIVIDDGAPDEAGSEPTVTPMVTISPTNTPMAI